LIIFRCRYFLDSFAQRYNLFKMHLKILTIANFKNIRETVINFSPRLNCFIGDNGAGKTNILDALYYLSFTKSFFNIVDQLNVNHTENWFLLKGLYERLDTEEQIICSFQEGQKKQVKRNSKAYRRMADHIGLLPLVMVSPNDSVFILGGSDERRKFMDSVISQFDADYLEDLIRYNRTLLQRNNMLKQMAQGIQIDLDILEVYNEQLVESGERIFGRRKSFINDLNPVFQKYYTAISKGVEAVGLIYQSDLVERQFGIALQESFSRDKAAQFTTVGVHKDDLSLTLGDYPIKKLGSQGQQKTYLVALKLAQFEFISQVAGIKPILLLDDIFDKLDKHRVEQIVKMVAGEQFGQIFITDTNREHLDTILQSVTSDYHLYKVINGEIQIME
jgi:DNA replication and repair protein RecF